MKLRSTYFMLYDACFDPSVSQDTRASFSMRDSGVAFIIVMIHLLQQLSILFLNNNNAL